MLERIKGNKNKIIVEIELCLILFSLFTGPNKIRENRKKIKLMPD